jgi:hypothetical protein
MVHIGIGYCRETDSSGNRAAIGIVNTRNLLPNWNSLERSLFFACKTTMLNFRARSGSKTHIWPSYVNAYLL